MILQWNRNQRPHSYICAAWSVYWQGRNSPVIPSTQPDSIWLQESTFFMETCFPTFLSMSNHFRHIQVFLVLEISACRIFFPSFSHVNTQVLFPEVKHKRKPSQLHGPDSAPACNDSNDFNSQLYEEI